MKTGRLTVSQSGPKRDVEVRITPDELYSEISEPAGVIRQPKLKGCNVTEEKTASGLRVHLDLSFEDRTVRFYTGETQADIALLLDELEASLGDFPRQWRKG